MLARTDSGDAPEVYEPERQDKKGGHEQGRHAEKSLEVRSAENLSQGPSSGEAGSHERERDQEGQQTVVERPVDVQRGARRGRVLRD
jgi:hypothetical protein